MSQRSIECGDQSEEPYSLYIESYPAVQEGFTTYRIYVNMEDATDTFSAVYGDADEPFVYLFRRAHTTALTIAHGVP